MRWVHVLLLTIIVLLPAGKATAKVYRCQGASGSTVLTDQPKGKTGCVAIDTATPRSREDSPHRSSRAYRHRWNCRRMRSRRPFRPHRWFLANPVPVILRYRRPLRRMPPRRPHQKRNVAHHASTR